MNRLAAALPGRGEALGTGDALPNRVLLGTFLAAMIVIVVRRPDAVFHAQFWAEDGTIFYANAYNLGLGSLLVPYSGYLNVVSQAVALLSRLVPLHWAPLVMNLSAIAIQALPAVLFVSSRFRRVPSTLRWVGAVGYLALPNAYEVHATITNVQWTLALLALLVVLAEAPASRAWRTFDTVILAAISLNGPLGILLLPFAGIVWWRRGGRWTRNHLLALLPGAAVQMVVLLLQSHVATASGATAPRLVSILARQVFVPSLLGLATVRQHLPLLTLPVELTIVTCALAALAFVSVRGPFELKVVVAFGGTVLAAGLWRPLVTYTSPPWEAFVNLPGAANRYFFLAEIAFLGSLIWIAWNARSPRAVRWVAVVVLLALPVGIARDWRYPALVDLHFREEARRFREALPGSIVVIPINPPGWTMELHKR